MKPHPSPLYPKPCRHQRGILLAPVIMGSALVAVLAVAWLAHKVGVGGTIGGASPNLGQWQQGLSQLKQQWQPASHNPIVSTQQQHAEFLALANGVKTGKAKAFLATPSNGTHQLSVNYGRNDPMMPLVQSAQASYEESVELDPLAGVAYVGMLKGSTANANVALIEYIDEATQNVKTMVKALGQSFLVNGMPVKLMSASPNQITLAINGKSRFLPLSDGQQKATIKETSATVSADKLPTVEDLEE